MKLLLLTILGILLSPNLSQAFGLSVEPAYHLETVQRDGATWDLYEGAGFMVEAFFVINPEWSWSVDIVQGSTKSNYIDIVPNSENFLSGGASLRMSVGTEKRVFLGAGGFWEKSNTLKNGFGLSVTGEIQLVRIQSFFVPLTSSFRYRLTSPAKRVITIGTGFGLLF